MGKFPLIFAICTKNKKNCAYLDNMHKQSTYSSSIKKNKIFTDFLTYMLKS